MRITHLLGVALAVVASACGSNSTLVNTAPSQRSSSKGRLEVITTEDIAGKTFQNAAEMVRELRPSWAQMGAAQGRQPDVYVNNAYYGDFSSLASFDARRVKEMYALSASEAQMKWGSSVHEVIQIIPK